MRKVVKKEEKKAETVGPWEVEHGELLGHVQEAWASQPQHTVPGGGTHRLMSGWPFSTF